MKHILLFENFDNGLLTLKLNDVIGSVKDYIYRTYTTPDTDKKSPYGCESRYYLEQMIEDSDAFIYYDIDFNDDNYWKSDDFLDLMSGNKYDFTLNNRFNSVKSELYKIAGSSVKIYRCISVNDEYINKLLNGDIENLGKYWSYTLDDIGVPDASKIDKLLVFCCTVKPNQIDWKQTILYNMNYHVGETEKEIILNPDAVLQLDKILYADSYDPQKISDYKRFPKEHVELNISNIKNKKFIL